MEFRGLNFFDFNDLAAEECRQLEAILHSASSAMQFPWGFKKTVEPGYSDVPLISGGPHYFSANQMQDHVLSTPVPMYSCPGPSMLPVLTYPHSVVLGPGGMYVTVVPMATALGSNIVSTNFPGNQPASVSYVNSTVYLPQPIMMGPMDPRFSSCPVTMPCHSVPALANHVLQESMNPVTMLYLPSESATATCVDSHQQCTDSGAVIMEENQRVGELLDRLSVKEGRLVQLKQHSSEVESLLTVESCQSSSETSKSQLPLLLGSSRDVSKVIADCSSLTIKGLSELNSPSFQSLTSDTRQSLVTFESSATVESKNIQNGPLLPAEPKVQKPKSWASLLHNTVSAANAIVVNSNGNPESVVIKTSDAADERIEKRPDCERGLSDAAPLQEDQAELMNLLKNHTVTHRSIYLQPRGLANRANWCYVNATLQALFACPPFYHLLKQISSIKSTFWEVSNFPAMKCMTQLVTEFPALSVKSLDKQAVDAKANAKIDVKCGLTLEPECVYKMLQEIDYEAFKLNQQEDAEEFLSCILNRLHDEMVNAMKQLENGDKRKEETKMLLLNESQNNEGLNEERDDDTRWEQVRARNRTAYSSTAATESSPISAIFRGQMCCILHQFGQKESATLQPFFTLQLDVQNEKVKSVEDALDQLVNRESLQGYTCTKSNTEVDATQRTVIEELPPVLVLHLKWFHYDRNGGLQKRIKQVDFDIDLELSKDLLSSHAKARMQFAQRRYKLFAVVSHIGVRAIGGHYIVDIFHPGYNCWLRCDDNSITNIPAALVTKFNSPKVPYMMFYRCFERS